MVQVCWLGQLSTSIPVSLTQVCQWVADERPDLVRAGHDGITWAPTASEVEAFIDKNQHLGQSLIFVYAREHGLVPTSASRPRPRLP